MQEADVQYVSPYVAISGESKKTIIRGIGFNDSTVSDVRFGDASASSFSVLSDTEIVATYPSLAAGAGTIYRNYFAKVKGCIGQTSNNQIDCLADIGVSLGNSDNHLWQMRNGYALASEEGLIEISNRIKSATESEVDELRRLLRIGIQWNTEVTLNDANHTVTQAYCSALPISYSQQSSVLWEAFARVVLEASYEATICASILNFHKTGNNKVYLTLLGGGAFGNERAWIIDAIERSLKLYKHAGLDVLIVSYGYSSSHVQEFIRNFRCG